MRKIVDENERNITEGKRQGGKTNIMKSKKGNNAYTNNKKSKKTVTITTKTMTTNEERI